jgi:DNA-binding LacI/PurR family transcriptional regulator
VFSTPVSAENVKRAIEAGVPLVQVERPRSELGHRLTVKNYQGAENAMRHLIELNHKCIAYIGEEPGTQSNAFADYVELERFGAYRDIMSSTGGWDEQLVRFARPKSPEHIPGTGHGYRHYSRSCE